SRRGRSALAGRPVRSAGRPRRSARRRPQRGVERRRARRSRAQARRGARGGLAPARGGRARGARPGPPPPVRPPRPPPGAPAPAETLGLPHGVRACLFDLDGVLTGSAEIHAAAWRESINDLLARRYERAGERFGPSRPFSAHRDYYPYLHGKPRLVGAHAFLA